MVRCRECGIELTNENWYSSQKKRKQKICKMCHNKATEAWQRKNPKKRNKIYTRWRRKHRKEWSAYLRKRRKEQREKIFAIIGNRCKICQRNETQSRCALHFHEIYGKKHNYNASYVLRHKEDFIPLCFICHRGVHFCMEYLDLSWKQIKEMVK